MPARVFFGFDARQRFVGWQAASAAEGRRWVAAAVNNVGDNRPVDIAFNKINENVLPDTVCLKGYMPRYARINRLASNTSADIT